MSTNNLDEFPSDSQYSLWLFLSQTRSAIFAARKKKVGRYLHPNQAIALCSIWAYKGQATSAMLARSLFLERHSVSELISRMEEKGLVKKTADPFKKNVIRLSVTEKGKQAGRHVIQLDFIKKLFSNLTDDQIDNLQTTLNILMKAAQKEMGNAEIQPLVPKNQDSKL